MNRKVNWVYQVFKGMLGRFYAFILLPCLLLAPCKNFGQHAFIKNIPQNCVNNRSIDSVAQAFDKAIIDHNDESLIKLYARLGKIMQANGFYRQSISYFIKSNQHAQEFKDAEQIAENYNNIATSYRRIDDYEPALDNLQKTLKIAKEVGSIKNQSFALNGLGNVYLALGKPDLALKYFEQSLLLSTQQKNTLEEAINYSNMGEAYMKKKDYANAYTYTHKSLELNRQLNNTAEIKNCIDQLSNIYLSLNRLDKATELAYLRISRPGKSEPYDSVYFHITISNIKRLEKNYEESITNAQIAIKEAKKHGLPAGIMEGYRALANTYKQMNNKDAYLHALEMSLLYRDSIFSAMRKRDMADLHSITEMEEKNFQIKQLMESNKAKDLENIKKQHLITIVLLSTTILLLLTLLFFKKITNKVMKSSRDIELKLCRSQLNPHFIYNSLNSIQKFIWSNEPESASVYLSNFAGLMRKTLESMRHNEVLLSRDISLIKLYLDLENQRLSNNFRYEIEMDPQIEPDEINVPPLILQPFVENAIWHGVAPLSTGELGQITIRYQKFQKFLVAQVQDNGIGINASRKIKPAPNSNHQSAGIKITANRLKYGLKMKNFEGITITDLADIDSNQRGTLVTIHIPFTEIF